MTHHPRFAASPVVASLRLQFLSYRIDVHTNSLRLATKIRSYFADYLAPEDAVPATEHLSAVVGETEYDASRLEVWSRASSPNRTPKESFYDDAGRRYILKNRTGVLIILAGDDSMIAGDLEGNANQVVNLIGTLFGLSLMRSGYVMLHASAVVVKGSNDGVIFLGNSGSGKSSVALQLIERGPYEYVSNDRVLLRATDGGVEMVGLPKKPRVNPGTLLASKRLAGLVPADKRRAYERLEPADLWSLEDKHDVDVGESFGARTRLVARLTQAYSLEWRPSGAGFESRQLDAEGAIAAMRVTAKDFGPYETAAAASDSTAEFERIAARVPFTAIAGKAAPIDFATMLATPELPRP